VFFLCHFCPRANFPGPEETNMEVWTLKSLRWKIAIIIVGFILVTGTVLGGVNYFSARSILEDEIYNR